MKTRKLLKAIAIVSVLSMVLCACGTKTITGTVSVIFDEDDYKLKEEKIDYTESCNVVYSDTENPGDYEACITDVQCTKSRVEMVIDFRNNSDEQCVVTDGDFFVNGYECSYYLKKDVDAGSSEAITISADAYRFNAEDVSKITIDLNVHEVLEKNLYYIHKPLEVIRCEAAMEKSDDFKGRMSQDTDIVIEDNDVQKIAIIGKNIEEYGDNDTTMKLYVYIENKSDDVIGYTVNDIKINGRSIQDDEDEAMTSWRCSPHKACIDTLYYTDEGEESVFAGKDNLRFTAVIRSEKCDSERSENERGYWINKKQGDLFEKNLDLKIVR